MRRAALSTTRIVLGLALAVLSVSALADLALDRAKQLLQQKQPEQAYELLLPLEAQRAGDPEFDYLLGIAALDSGHRERAIFALERVLAVQPNNALARAEIARAYLAVGEKDTARREFEAVKREPIPPRQEPPSTATCRRSKRRRRPRYRATSSSAWAATAM